MDVKLLEENFVFVVSNQFMSHVKTSKNYLSVMRLQ